MLREYKLCFNEIQRALSYIALQSQIQIYWTIIILKYVTCNSCMKKIILQSST